MCTINQNLLTKYSDISATKHSLCLIDREEFYFDNTVYSKLLVSNLLTVFLLSALCKSLTDSKCIFCVHTGIQLLLTGYI